MDTAEEESYIQLAARNPNMLCSDLPFEILQACSFSDNEPTEFLRRFFRAGHIGWLTELIGRQTEFDPELIDRAVFVLWIRASSLYTSYMIGREDKDWIQQLFSDEGLYD